MYALFSDRQAAGHSKTKTVLTQKPKPLSEMGWYSLAGYQPSFINEQLKNTEPLKNSPALFLQKLQ